MVGSISCNNYKLLPFPISFVTLQSLYMNYQSSWFPWGDCQISTRDSDEKPCLYIYICICIRVYIYIYIIVTVIAFHSNPMASINLEQWPLLLMWRRHVVRGLRARAPDGSACGGHRGDHRTHEPAGPVADRRPARRSVCARRTATVTGGAAVDGRGTRLVGECLNQKWVSGAGPLCPLCAWVHSGWSHVCWSTAIDRDAISLSLSLSLSLSNRLPLPSTQTHACL